MAAEYFSAQEVAFKFGKNLNCGLVGMHQLLWFVLEGVDLAHSAFG